MFFAGVVAAVPEQGKIIHGPRDLPAEIRLTEPPLSPAARAFHAPLRAQTAFVYDLFDRFLREQGAHLDDLVKLNIYLRDVARDRRDRGGRGAIGAVRQSGDGALRG